MTDTDWDKLEEEVVARNRKASEKAEANIEQRRLSGELEDIHAKGVRLGWWDAEGNKLIKDEEDDEDGDL